jgi:hypothetical protein
MKITSDQPAGRAAQRSVYADIFSRLTPQANCLVLDTPKDTGKISQALASWAKHHAPDAKVTSTKAYPKDGKPRVWLIWPERPQTHIRGNFPRSA